MVDQTKQPSKSTTRKAVKKESVKEKPVKDEKPVKVVEKIVEKPIRVEKLSRSQRAKLTEDIVRQDIQDHLNVERQRIKDVLCPECGKSLKLKPEDYLKTGNKPQRIECPSCERIIRVQIRYPGPVQTTSAEITTKSRGYAWATQHPSTWKDSDVEKWVEQEEKAFSKNRSSLSPESQKLFRVLSLVLKKLEDK
ncbi:MAG: hypothetical protein K8E24_012090 [Methanobacterium paludis]|nr:hypothetical protein [Methanobacterium paludis]